MSASESFEHHGAARSFRPQGAGRYVSAVFLAVWLTGWAIGEILALAVLAAILVSLTGLFPEDLPSWGGDMVRSGGVIFAVLFLIVWLTFWTIGGVAALTHMLRSLAGEDVIAVTASGVDVVHRAGPFRKRRVFERATVKRVRIRLKDSAVVMDTTTGTHVLTSFGSRVDRDAVAGWLRENLNLSSDAPGTARIPEAWDERTDADVTRLRKVRPRARTIRSAILWTLTGLLVFASTAPGDTDVTFRWPALILIVVLAIGAAASTWASREWLVRHGELTFEWRVGAWSSVRTFRNARLEIIHTTDSDNDSHYKLTVLDGEKQKVIHAQMNDFAEVVDLGHWLAARTGFPFSP